LLSAPAINPIVLTATAVAFPRDPEMVVARFVMAGTVKLLELLGFRRHGDVLTDAAGRRTVRLQKSFGPDPAARSEVGG
ncbi:hypothetical protein ACWD74_39845, partial [Streptomyces fagopyri]